MRTFYLLLILLLIPIASAEISYSQEDATAALIVEEILPEQADIIVGGPCSFSEWETILDMRCADWDLSEGESMMRVIEDPFTIFIAGTTQEDTLMLATTLSGETGDVDVNTGADSKTVYGEDAQRFTVREGLAFPVTVGAERVGVENVAIRQGVLQTIRFGQLDYTKLVRGDEIRVEQARLRLVRVSDTEAEFLEFD